MGFNIVGNFKYSKYAKLKINKIDQEKNESQFTHIFA